MMKELILLRFPEVKIKYSIDEFLKKLGDRRIKAALQYIGVLEDGSIFVIAEKNVADVIPLLLKEMLELNTVICNLVDRNTPLEKFDIVEVYEIQTVGKVKYKIPGWMMGGIAPSIFWNEKEVVLQRMANKKLKEILSKRDGVR